MKIEFEKAELIWLEDKMKKLQYLVGRVNDPEMSNIISKMKFKFSPNCRYVNLNLAERTFVESVVKHRIEALGPTSLEDELQLAQGIQEKVSI